MTETVGLVVVEDAEAAAREVAHRLAASARAGDEIALAGGSTPRRAYELAALLAPDWGRAGLWWGDERCVPPGDPRSNYTLARSALLDALARPPGRIHRIRGELPAEQAASDYDEALRDTSLGLTLLGIGADGHTASLFPGDLAVEERARLAVPVHAPDVDRVTLTVPALNATRHVLFLAVGGDKADAVRRALTGGGDVPAAFVRGAESTTAVLDRAAAATLDN